MKYLKLFQTNAQYTEYIEGDAILPNVSSIVETESVEFNPYVAPPAAVGDVAYWDGSKVKTCALDSYDESLGTAVGVVVIPENFLPDGKARMIALNQSNFTKDWGPTLDISDLFDYDKVPITRNVDSTATGYYDHGFLPSDKFTGDQSFVDPLAKYSRSNTFVPSPYLSDGTLNPEYIKTIDGYNNVLSDFDGKGNTDILVGLGSDYAAANHAKNYTIDGVTGIDWYLPACGELGVMMSRLGSINTVISALGGVTVNVGVQSWSSSEFNADYAFYIDTRSGRINRNFKCGTYGGGHVRSFAIID